MNIFKGILNLAKNALFKSNTIEDNSQGLIEEKRKELEDYLSSLFNPMELITKFVAYSWQDFKIHFLGQQNASRKDFNKRIDAYADTAKQKIQEKIKGAIKKKLLQLLVKAMQAVIKCLPIILKVVLIILAVIAVIALIWYIFSMFPSLSNLFSFSYGFDKTSYYDTELFQAVKNKELMEENLYERTAQTSYYQRFVDANIKDFATAILPETLNDENDTRKWEDRVEEAQKEFTGFYSLDGRLTLHDANLNGMTAFLQANTMSSKLDQSSDVQGYLRDYFNKETNFELSNQFLMQLNNKAFANYGNNLKSQLVYPEIFTKPVSYVYDFNRMELLREYDTLEKRYNYNWDEYTYVTQRVTKNDIGKKVSDTLTNYNELEWGKYYGIDTSDELINKEDEGKIISFPSPIVWEYVIKDKDDYKLYQLDPEKDPAIVTNKYHSEYLLFKNDETKEELIPKFYYKIVSRKDTNSFNTSNGFDTTTGGNADEYTFDGPYMILNHQSVGASDINNALNSESKVIRVNNDGVEDPNGLWFKIKIPEGYRLIDDVAPFLTDENGVETPQERTKNDIMVNATYNSEPKKHLQLAHLVGNNGDVAVSSQNLINYKYFKFKTITEGFRNKQDYVDGWATYISGNEDFFSTYSDRSFWGALGNRLSAFGGLFTNIKKTENDLDDADSEDKALFQMISEYPEDALNLSLYLYEQDFKNSTEEGDNTWKYDYSVNNYFRTDNDKLESLGDYQKYFYVLEELEMYENNPDSPTKDMIDKALQKYTSVDNGIDITTYTNIETLRTKMKEDMTDISKPVKKTLQLISNKMSTRYMNLGQPKTTTIGTDTIITGEQISAYSGIRLGEISLESTLFYNSDLHSEMISFSKSNEKNKDIQDNFEFDFSYKTWNQNVSDWWNNLWGQHVDSSISQTVKVSAQEHSHLQNDYYIVENNLNKFSSNVLEDDKDGKELPLEIKSVRDYGLGSVLNYVDSVVVEYQSGMIYDENYLKQKIGETIKTEYTDIYSTYHVQNPSDIGEGYFPKEMKDQGSDTLIELFAQNNKKELFKSLVEALDGKIIAASADYDNACKNPEMRGLIPSLDNLSIDSDLDNIGSISVSGNFDGATGSGSASATLSGNIGSDGFGSVSISGVTGDVFFDGEENSTFKYYTPSLTGPSSISQLVLPKRFYRSWLEKDDDLTTMSSVKKWITVKLKKDNFIYKSNGLPDLVNVVAGAYKNKGINNYYSSALSLVRSNRKLNGSSAVDYATQLLEKNYNKKNFKEGLTGEYEYIKENDLKKVYLMDEVVTFAGKFMYTYKDTLLTTTSSADENMPKSVIGSYGTDRYIFLDGWDVKLLTDRIAKVDFMLFSVEGKINYNGEWVYISEYIDKINDDKSSSLFGFAKHFLSTFNDLQDTCKSTYMLAVPYNFSNEYFESTGSQLNDIFKNSTDNNGHINKDRILSELEDYTRFVYDGFLFDESLESSLFTRGGGTGGQVESYNLMTGNLTWQASQEEIENFKEYVKENAEFSVSDAVDGLTFSSIEDSLPSYEVHILVQSKYPETDNYDELETSIDKYLNDLSSGKFETFTSSDWDSYISSNYNDFGAQNVWSSKSKIKSNVKKFLRDTNSGDFETGEMENAIINELVSGSTYGYCHSHYHQILDDSDGPGIIYQDELNSILKNSGSSTGNFILDVFGAVQDFLNELAEKVLNLITGFEITSDNFNVQCVKFINTFIGDSFFAIDENSVDSYFNKYVKVLDSQIKEFSNEDYFTFSYKLKTGNGTEEDGTGRCFTNKKLIRYTLRVSDEIALDTKNGRYTSQLSGYGNNGSTVDITENNSSGELLYISGNNSSGATTANNITTTIINSEEFLNIYNSRASQTFGIDEWNKMWNPQLKIFDDVDNIAYISDVMKEYVFGSIKNNVNNEGDIYTSKGIMSGKYVKEIENPRDYFFFSSLRTMGDYKFLKTLFNGTATNISNYRKGFKLQTELPHPNFFDDGEGIEHSIFDINNDKETSINLTDTGEAIVPSSKIDLTAFTEALDYFYSEKACQMAEDTINNGRSLGVIATEDKDNFHITGFSLVPRMVDRRDEPTIYPLYRYWGGAKKKIEPSEKLRYFEGQTYDTWLSKMKVNENTDEEGLEYFKKEKNRLSEYLKSYLENFETYVPYNILADKDLEVRGTAGYGDLMTNYTLTPVYTKEYTQLFENEASKVYWTDILKTYDITQKDLAQLLQGLAEISLSTAGADALRLLRSGSSPEDVTIIKEQRIVSDTELGNIKPEYSNENIDILSQAIMNTVDGSNSFRVKLKTEGGGEAEYLLPIAGIAAIDDLREKSEDSTTDGSTVVLPQIRDFNNFAIIGNFSDSIKGLSGSATYLINETSTAEEFMNDSAINDIKDKDGIVLMLGAGDIVKSTEKGADTGKARSIISKMQAQNPNAKIYIVPYPGFANYDEFGENDVLTFSNGLSPNQAGFTYNYNSYTDANTELIKFNAKLKTYSQSLSGVEILDFTSNFDSGLSGLDINYVNNGIYFKDNDLVGLIKGDLLPDSNSPDITLSDNVKTTRYLKPNNDKMEPYEVDLNILKTNRDDRLDQKKSVEFMSFRLYKMISSTGDVLKGIYSYYYGVDFVQSLVSVTADNAKNLVENPEHGLWYNPTEEDIRKALGENVVLSDDIGNLRDAFGVKKLKDTFSFVTNIENRKKIVIGASNSSSSHATGQLPGINVDNPYATYPQENGAEWTEIAGEGYKKSFTYDNNTNYYDLNRNRLPVNGTTLDMTGYTYDTTMKSTGGLLRGDGDLNISNIGGRGAVKSKLKMDPSSGIGYVEEDGVKYYIGALGSAFIAEGDMMGGKYIVTTDEGNSWYFMTIDTKADRHTDDENILSLSSYAWDNSGDSHVTIDERVKQSEQKVTGCATEFYINYDVARANGYVTSSVNTWELPDGQKFSGNVISIVPVDKADKIVSGGRDYIDELWESQYMKYQNTGVYTVINHMNGSDIDDLINMTANYRNNNEEQNDYGYTYLDFFKNINKVKDKNTKEFTGQRDSLILNAMRYLGAHYTQQSSSFEPSRNGLILPRISNLENMTSDGSATSKYTFSTYLPTWRTIYYVEDVNYPELAETYGFDCSSYVGAMYAAMGYELPGANTASYRSNFSQYPGNCVTAEVNHDPSKLMTGDILVPTGHAMMWIGEYTTNYNDLFNEEDLLCNDPAKYWNTGKDSLSQANTNCVGKTNVIIHQGGSYNSHSSVSIKERPNVLNQRDCKVFRIFNDDVEYSKTAMEEAGMLCPTIFSKTTIQNNPYLVEYMENSGTLQQELANGMFTMEDVESAKNAIAKSRGEDIEEDNLDEDEEHFTEDNPVHDNNPQEPETELETENIN